MYTENLVVHCQLLVSYHLKIFKNFIQQPIVTLETFYLFLLSRRRFYLLLFQRFLRCASIAIRPRLLFNQKRKYGPPVDRDWSNKPLSFL